jgi:hypothetical protein
MVVIWDRWGKSGRSRNPTAHHFSEKAKRYIEDRGAKLMMLPAAGKYFNPIERVFGDVKRNYENSLRKNSMFAIPQN